MNITVKVSGQGFTAEIAGEEGAVAHIMTQLTQVLKGEVSFSFDAANRFVTQKSRWTKDHVKLILNELNENQKKVWNALMEAGLLPIDATDLAGKIGVDSKALGPIMRSFGRMVERLTLPEEFIESWVFIRPQGGASKRYRFTEAFYYRAQDFQGDEEHVP